MGLTVNEVPYSWADIRVKILSEEVIGFEAIKYSDKVSPEAVYGARRHLIGYTRGKVEVEPGSITMLESEVRDLLDKLGDGWADVVVPAITVQYGNAGQRTHTDVIENVRFVGLDGGGEDGSSGLKREIPIVYTRIKRDGKYIVARNK
jgi:hypothetical protein